MKHHETAAGLASLGRYGDTTLVHMSPDEVASLQRLAQAHGHTLTINPETGLPEAFSLGRFLKAIAPVALGAIGAAVPGLGAITPFLVGGGYALGSGSLTQGLMAGLGAYGGAGLGKSLLGLGGPETAAGTAAKTAGSAMEQGAYVQPTAFLPEAAGTASPPTAFLPDASPAAQAAAATPEAIATKAAPVSGAFGEAGSNLSRMGSGLSSLNPMTEAGRSALGSFLKTNLRPLATAYMGTAGLAAANQSADQGKIPTAAGLSNWQFSGDRFNPGTVNPRFGERGQPYFLGRGFTPGPYSSTFQGLTMGPPQAAPALATPSNPYAYVESTAPYNFAEGGEIDPTKPEQPFARPEFSPTLASVGPPPQTFTPEQMSGISSARNQFANMLAGGQGLGALSSGTGLGNYLSNIKTGTTGGGTAGTTPPDLSSYLNNIGSKISGTPVPQYLNTDGSVTTGGFNPNVPGPGTYSGPAQGVYGTGVNQAYVDAALKQNTPEWQKYALQGATEAQIPQDIRLINNVTGGDNVMDPADIARVESQIAMSRTGTGSAPESTQAMLDAVKSVNPEAYSQIMADLRGGNVTAIGAPEKAVTHQDQIDWYNQTFGTPASANTAPATVAQPTPQETKAMIGDVLNSFLGKPSTTQAPQEQTYSTDPWADYYAAMGGMSPYKYAGGGKIQGGIGSMPEYAAGGKLLNGPGDGMSDSIPAVIKGQQPQRAALADGEFVIPADVVSHLGNGSTKAGSKRLYDMMDKVRKARTGRTAQGKQINPDKFLPV
jgi:hypothetical protein